MKKYFFIALLLCQVSALANEGNFEPKEPLKMPWSFEGPLGTFDKQAIRRGLKVYQQVCAACHSLNRISFRHLLGAGFSLEEAKSIASEYQVKDGPNDDGEYYERPGALSDYFVPPYANRKAAEAANNGAYPPDLSLIARGRMGGASYLYSLLIGFTDEEAPEGLYSNPYFSTGKIAMAPPLSEDIVSYEDGTPATVEQMAFDVVNFLQWASEYEMEYRKRLGLKVMGFLSILLVLSWVSNKRIWKDIKQVSNEDAS
ncbi:ubiquinol-Cytochrome c reductase, cytochrome c1 [Neorickettsia risticii str. Illinois]|uniref:Cytochrome c1 n=1 Tax=Neorickettsia risticii (strain Illinois) TaxID=434131 RepID=C6V5A7_NEORI|nr:cytochrome c1 [Neorickettsia risticii]ACT69529.1 ubiquinol-Cytochrome c reductase, cytochrome c1 [Neorickettsia risticii str. Illinois]